MSRKLWLAVLAPAASLVMSPATSGEPRAVPVDGTIVIAQATTPAPRPPVARPVAPAAKTCRREPIWGFRMSPFCKPTGICSDRVIKGYRTVCS